MEDNWRIHDNINKKYIDLYLYTLCKKSFAMGWKTLNLMGGSVVRERLKKFLIWRMTNSAAVSISIDGDFGDEFYVDDVAVVVDGINMRAVSHE